MPASIRASSWRALGHSTQAVVRRHQVKNLSLLQRVTQDPPHACMLYKLNRLNHGSLVSRQHTGYGPTVKACIRDFLDEVKKN